MLNYWEFLYLFLMHQSTNLSVCDLPRIKRAWYFIDLYIVMRVAFIYHGSDK